MTSTEERIQLKHHIADLYPDFAKNATKAWAEVLREMDAKTKEIADQGSDYIPIVNFAELASLSGERLEELKRKGTFVVRNVVPLDQAKQWKQDLEAFVAANPGVDGLPIDNPQHFQVFYTKPQILARSHPNVLATQKWCNELWNTPSALSDAVKLDQPLTYADRFRIRRPGISWSVHPPHMDGGSLERWLNPAFRSVYEDILQGNWNKYDPYALGNRLSARDDNFGLPNQCSVFRTFQGWLSFSDTGPHEGTLEVFPEISVSTAYIMLRPFFTPKSGASDLSRGENWIFDLSSPVFHGVNLDSSAGKTGGVRPFEFSDSTHPNMRLKDTMVAMPTVHPGDMVFWHCDMVHAVEKEHHGKGDSSVMYLQATPSTPGNLDYVKRQAADFEKGLPPPDFPKNRCELEYKLIGRPADITLPQGRAALGLTA